MQSLSIVIPVFHNSSTLTRLHRRLSAVLLSLAPCECEVIYVDDGSQDDSYEQLCAIAAADERARVVKLSRNFGSTSAILAGLAHASGDCVAVIAADLQDPPELVGDLVARQQQGFDVVLAARSGRDDPLTTRIFSGTFYRLFKRFAIPSMPLGGFDCFLLTRRAYRFLVETARSDTYLMGQILWLGFPRSLIYYHRQQRGGGRSMWTFWKKVRYFIDSFVSFSYAPIRAASLLGVCLAFLGFIYAIVVIGYRVFYSFPVEGWSSLMIVVLLLGGAQLMVLGTLGEYLWRTLDASRKRPAFIVEDLVNAPRGDAAGSSLGRPYPRWGTADESPDLVPVAAPRWAKQMSGER